jgi:hypothetical protein
MSGALPAACAAFIFCSHASPGTTVSLICTSSWAALNAATCSLYQALSSSENWFCQNEMVFSSVSPPGVLLPQPVSATVPTTTVATARARDRCFIGSLLR